MLFLEIETTNKKNKYRFYQVTEAAVSVFEFINKVKEQEKMVLLSHGNLRRIAF